MKRHVLLALALFSFGSAALACRCISTDDPAKLRQFAADVAGGAVGLVEAEALTSYSPNTGGEQMRVIRVLAGKAPQHFRVERGSQRSWTSCDTLYAVGQREVIVLYPTSANSNATTYRISESCTGILLEKPIFRDAVARRIGHRANGNGERG